MTAPDMKRWSAPLDIGEPRALTAASPGMVVVVGSRATVAYDAKGDRQWRLDRAFTTARTLPDGRTILRTATDVRVVDFLGETLTGWSRSGSFAPVPLAPDRVVDVDDAGVLACTTLDGTVEWKVELGCRPLQPPTVADGAIVVADATGLRVHDHHGTQKFRGALVTGAAKPGQTRFACAEGPILPFGGGYLAPVRNASQGAGWYLWRPEHAEIAAFAAGAALAGPAAVSDDRFIAAGPDTADDGKQFVRAFALPSARAWELAAHRVVAIVGLARGRAALVSSPTAERWDKYRQFHKVEDECRITVVDRNGAVSRSHVVGEPLAPLAAHAGGLVYVARPSALLALAAE